MRVVVVGSGMAGLGAAAALRAAGTEVVVVEARDRIGGRVHTSRLWPDLPIDMGASWIHGVKGNPVTELAREAGAATVETSYDSAAMHIDPALAALGARDLGAGAAEASFDRAMKWAERQPRDVSIQAALDAVVARGSLDPVRRAQLDFYVNSTYEQEYSGSASQLSAWAEDNDHEFGGNDALFPGGYGQLIDHLARGIDIRLNRVVTAVRTRANGVTLAVADGSSLTADHAVITVPLGVLKAGAIAFDPPLSAPKQDAVGRLGMGLLNKHWLRFDRVFWDKRYDWHEYLSASKGEWTEWVSLAKVDDTPVLLAFSAADRAERVERMSDRDILAGIMATARHMFGNAIPEPIATQFSRWRSDPFARGSYSFYAVGSRPTDRKALARSEGTRLHFAGEAQSHLYPGTVHGALLSGREAAARIMRKS